MMFLIILLFLILFLFIIYKIDNAIYNSWIKDIENKKVEKLIYKLTERINYNSFKRKATEEDIKNILLLLDKCVKLNTFFLLQRPVLFGTALGKLSFLNNECRERAIQWCSCLSASLNEHLFIKALLETNPSIEGKVFLSVLRNLKEREKEELVKFLSNDTSISKYLNLI